MAGMWTLPAASYQATASPPPPPAVSRAFPAGDISSRPHSSANGASGASGSGSAVPDPPAAGLPEAPTALPELERMSLHELQSINGDASKFDHYISTHKHTRAVEATLGAIRKDVEMLEEKKMKDMFLFSQNKGVVSEEEVEELNCKITDVSAQVEALRKEREDWVSRNTEHHLEQRLRALIEETERESEVLLEQWNADVIDYSEFMPRYLAVRTKLAERKLKLDTFQEKLLQARLSAGANQSR